MVVQVNKLEDNIQSLAKKPDIQMSDLLLKVWGSYVSWAILLTRIMMLCVLKALKAFKMVSGSQQHEEEMSCESSCLTRQGHSREAALDTPFLGSCRYACSLRHLSFYQLTATKGSICRRLSNEKCHTNCFRVT